MNTRKELTENLTRILGGPMVSGMIDNIRKNKKYKKMLDDYDDKYYALIKKGFTEEQLDSIGIKKVLRMQASGGVPEVDIFQYLDPIIISILSELGLDFDAIDYLEEITDEIQRIDELEKEINENPDLTNEQHIENQLMGGAADGPPQKITGKKLTGDKLRSMKSLLSKLVTEKIHDTPITIVDSHISRDQMNEILKNLDNIPAEVLILFVQELSSLETIKSDLKRFGKIDVSKIKSYDDLIDLIKDDESARKVFYDTIESFVEMSDEWKARMGFVSQKFIRDKILGTLTAPEKKQVYQILRNIYGEKIEVAMEDGKTAAQIANLIIEILKKGSNKQLADFSNRVTAIARNKMLKNPKYENATKYLRFKYNRITEPEEPETGLSQEAALNSVKTLFMKKLKDAKIDDKNSKILTDTFRFYLKNMTDKEITEKGELTKDQINMMHNFSAALETIIDEINKRTSKTIDTTNLVRDTILHIINFPTLMQEAKKLNPYEIYKLIRDNTASLMINIPETPSKWEETLREIEKEPRRKPLIDLDEDDIFDDPTFGQLKEQQAKYIKIIETIEKISENIENVKEGGLPENQKRQKLKELEKEKELAKKIIELELEKDKEEIKKEREEHEPALPSLMGGAADDKTIQKEVKITMNNIIDRIIIADSLQNAEKEKRTKTIKDKLKYYVDLRRFAPHTVRAIYEGPQRPPGGGPPGPPGPGPPGPPGDPDDFDNDDYGEYYVVLRLRGRRRMYKLGAFLGLVSGIGGVGYYFKDVIMQLLKGQDTTRGIEKDTTEREGFKGEKHARINLPNGEMGTANYLGPGTHLLERIKRGDPPRTPTDRAAMIHDMDYFFAALADDKETQLDMVRKADKDMIKRMEEIKNKKLDDPTNISIGLELMKAKVGLENIGIISQNIFAGDLEKASDEDIKIISIKYKEMTNTKPTIPRGEVPEGFDPFTPDVEIRTTRETMKQNKPLNKKEIVSGMDPTIEQQTVLHNYYVDRYNEKLEDIQNETDPKLRDQMLKDLDKIKTEVNRSASFIDVSQQKMKDPEAVTIPSYLDLEKLLPDKLKDDDRLKPIGITPETSKYYQEVGLIEDIKNYNNFVDDFNEAWKYGGAINNQYYLSEYKDMRQSILQHQTSTMADLPQADTPFDEKEKYKQEQEILINNQTEFLMVLSELEQAKEQGASPHRIEELYSHLEDLREELKEQETTTYDARDAYLIAKDQPISLNFTEFGGETLPQKITITQNLKDKGLNDVLNDYNNLTDQYIEAHNSHDEEALLTLTPQLTNARDAAAFAAKQKGVLPEREAGIEDDPSSFVDIQKPTNNQMSIKDKATATLLSNKRDPPEAKLFLQKKTPEELMKEKNDWNKYMMVDHGFGLGSARQNSLAHSNLMSERRRFTNTFKPPNTPAKQPTASQIYNDIKPLNQQSVWTPIYQGAFGKDKFEDEHHNPYIKNNKVIFTNPYLPTNNFDAWENKNSIYHPEYALYDYESRAVPIGETSKPSEYRFTNDRYNMTRGVNTERQNETWGFPKDGLKTMDNTDLFTIGEKSILPRLDNTMDLHGYYRPHDKESRDKKLRRHNTMSLNGTRKSTRF